MKQPRLTKRRKKEPDPKHGQRWLNSISGLEYRWDSKKRLWISTGKYPYGTNPMGFLGDSAS